MILFFRQIFKNLPTFLIALTMALASWIAAVTVSDPNEMREYSLPIPVEVLGQDPRMVVTGGPLKQIRVKINAPRSTWTQLNSQSSHIQAYVDLAGLQPGLTQVPVQVQIDVKPVRLISVEPPVLDIVLEPLISNQMAVEVVRRGEPAVGYLAETPVINPESVSITGPASLINQIQQIRALVDLTQARQGIQTNVAAQPMDVNGELVDGVNIEPASVAINLPITQKGGYRNVVVKVVTTGKLASGYRLTNISVYPPNVTVYSSDPEKVDSLPGYVDTLPINLDNLRNDISLPVDLNLPEGVSQVGTTQVVIQAGVDAIESSVTYSRIKLVTEGLSTNLSVTYSPEMVDVILSGPLPILDQLTTKDIQVVLNLKGKTPGTYQLTPVVQLTSNDIAVESILPASIEVVIQSITPTPKP